MRAAADDLDRYAADFRQPGAMRAGFELYRAFAQDDRDNRAALASKGKLAVPCSPSPGRPTCSPGQVYGTTSGPAPGHRYELPANLQRFFAGNTSTQPAQSIPNAQPTAVVDTLCCPPAEQATCCDTRAKADCCADATDQGCGCR